MKTKTGAQKMHKPCRAALSLLLIPGAVLLTAAPVRAQLAPPPFLGPTPPAAGTGTGTGTGTTVSGSSGAPPGADSSMGQPFGQTAAPLYPPASAVTTAAVGAQPPESVTEQKLQESERADSGRSFELFYLRAHLGPSYMNLASFSAETLAIEKKSATGVMTGLDAGLRFAVFVLGARLRFHPLSAFSLWQINATIGTQIPIGPFDLGFGLHGGYSFSGRVASDALGTAMQAASPDVKIRGANVGVDASLDYYITSMFSLGAGISAEGLLLKRPPIDLPAGAPAEIQNSELYKNSGTSFGIGIAGGLRLGLHLGI
jgi:hypothetical protein